MNLSENTIKTLQEVIDIPVDKTPTLSHGFIKDQVRKAEEKLSQNDYDGDLQKLYRATKAMRINRIKDRKGGRNVT